MKTWILSTLALCLFLSTNASAEKLIRLDQQSLDSYSIKSFCDIEKERLKRSRSIEMFITAGYKVRVKVKGKTYGFILQNERPRRKYFWANQFGMTNEREACAEVRSKQDKVKHIWETLLLAVQNGDSTLSKKGFPMQTVYDLTVSFNTIYGIEAKQVVGDTSCATN